MSLLTPEDNFQPQSGQILNDRDFALQMIRELQIETRKLRARVVTLEQIIVMLSTSLPQEVKGILVNSLSDSRSGVGNHAMASKTDGP